MKGAYRQRNSQKRTAFAIIAMCAGLWSAGAEETLEATRIDSRALLLSLLVLAGICIVLFIVVIVNLLVSAQNMRTQNEKFEEMLSLVSGLTRASGPVVSPLPPPLPYEAGSLLRYAGTAGTSALPAPPANNAEKKELDELARTCREAGQQIDLATGRKNNSKNVAEMVYKIVTEKGVPGHEAMLYFSVAMVYDIGFLAMDANLLQAENLTEEEKHEIRNHVKQGLARLSFVPEKYLGVFADGVNAHHENMDGSGYPEGLLADRIPYIARLIRVAESFVALVSRRSYREIIDKESAVDELRKRPGLYDQEIVDILEHII